MSHVNTLRASALLVALLSCACDAGEGEVEVRIWGGGLDDPDPIELTQASDGLRFDAIADADTDAEGDLSMAELAATDIGAHDPGNLAIDDLWSFLAALAQTMGHVDGEGHCVS